MPSAAGVDKSIDRLIDRLTTASKQPARSRSFELEPVVSSICALAYESGLDTDALGALIDIIAVPTRLDQTSITTLIKSLYPAARVSADVVYRIVSCLGQGQARPSNATQASLLQWLLAVRDVFEDEGALVNCYAALFNHLPTLAIRPALCHLLAALTRRRHVKPWRIHVLLEMARDAAAEAGVLDLLRVYRDFYPEIVTDQPLYRKRGAGFKLPDAEWTERLRLIQARNAGETDVGAAQASSFRVIRRGFKRTKAEVIPDVHTLRNDVVTVTLEEIDGADDLATRLADIEPPSQIIAALDDPLLQKYLTLVERPDLQRRFDGWLSLYLDSQAAAAAGHHAADKSLGDVLEKALNFHHHTKTLPAPIVSYLQSSLASWDGQQHRSTILQLISCLPQQRFEDLQSEILASLEDAVLADGSHDSLCALLDCYSRLFRNWTFQALASPSPSHASNLRSLAAHSSLLGEQILCTDPAPSHSHAVLSHLAATSHAASLTASHPATLSILAPSPRTIYQLLFANSSPTLLSSACAFLAASKHAYEACQRAGATSAYDPAALDEFNGFLMDASNLLWRARAFNAGDPAALACLLDPDVAQALGRDLGGRDGRDLVAAFLVCQHPALAAAGARVLRALGAVQLADAGHDDAERAAWARLQLGALDQRRVAEITAAAGIRLSWQDFRVGVLRWLNERGLPGPGALMSSTMKNLLDRQRRERESAGMGT